MLQGSFASVQDVRSQEDLRNELVRFAAEKGFDYMGAFVAVDSGRGRYEVAGVDNAPKAWIDAQRELSVGLLRRDPVSQHCRFKSVPIIWDQSTYTVNGSGDLWEEQASFGYCNGIAMGLHLPEGRHFVFGVDRSTKLPTDVGELTRLVADLQLFAVHALDAALRLLNPRSEAENLPALTSREVEVLRWTMDGKTAWEVGAILGISERTAVLHLSNAMHKLDCVSKHQAVLKAIRLGLIR